MTCAWASCTARWTCKREYKTTFTVERYMQEVFVNGLVILANLPAELQVSSWVTVSKFSNTQVK